MHEITFHLLISAAPGATHRNWNEKSKSSSNVTSAKKVWERVLTCTPYWTPAFDLLPSVRHDKATADKKGHVYSLTTINDCLFETYASGKKRKPKFLVVARHSVNHRAISTRLIHR